MHMTGSELGDHTVTTLPYLRQFPCDGRH